MRLRTALVLVAGFGLFAIAYGIRPDAYSEAGRIIPPEGTYADIAANFADLAQAKGAPYAYEVLRRVDLPPNIDVHLLGHVIGDVLYAQEGIEGIAVCTQDFRNACSHAVVIGALYEFGLDILPEVREACRKAPGGPGAYTMCFHGFGHGVFSYFNDNLSRTVEYCKEAGTSAYRDREYLECVGGAIMELMGDGGHAKEALAAAREKYLTGPLEPCVLSVIPDDAKPMCLSYLTPHIWESAGMDRGNPDPALFGKAFSACDTLADAELRDACFGGFGKEFVGLAAARDTRDLSIMREAQFREIDAWCSTATALDGQSSCIRSALMSFYWGGENDAGISFGFCASLMGDLQYACYAQLSFEIGYYTTESAREPLCGRLPEEFKASCRTTRYIL